MSPRWKIGPALVWTLGILVMASLPGTVTDAVDKPLHADKLLHLVVFTLGGILWALATGSAWKGALLAFLVGLGKEILQEFVPGRSFELADVVADAIGSALGSYLFHRYVRPRISRFAQTSPH